MGLIGLAQKMYGGWATPNKQNFSKIFYVYYSVFPQKEHFKHLRPEKFKKKFFKDQSNVYAVTLQTKLSYK